MKGTVVNFTILFFFEVMLTVPFMKVLSVWIAQRPPGFGFVLFQDPRDAQVLFRKTLIFLKKNIQDNV